ncbi:hypothetical protein RZN22_15580 [Bacillaceae bacterium S4-13-58]
MVIQANMSTKAIVGIWENTIEIFKQYQIPLGNEPLESFMEQDALEELLAELNDAVGSSSDTCVNGG